MDDSSMDDDLVYIHPRGVDAVFMDFRGRRAGILKALTSDVEGFFIQCDPNKDNLCLYGFPDESWEVSLPSEDIPPQIPEPAIGINFARDGMLRKDWLSLVASHSDAWLLSVAYFFGAAFPKSQRNRLFNMINELPTLLDVVNGRIPPPVEEKTNISNRGETKVNSQRAVNVQPKQSQPPPPPKEEEDTLKEEEENGDTFCGSCGGNYAITADEFWIACDGCERWFHGKCMKISPARAEHIKFYYCPSCSNK